MPTVATAQAPAGFSLNRFRPAPTTEDGLALVLPRTLGHLRPGVALTLDYAHQPLVLAVPGDNPEGAIVEHRLTGHLHGALGIGERFEVSLHVPVTFLQAGDEPSLTGISFPDPQSASFGDLAVGGTVRLVGGDLAPFQLGLAAHVTVPSGGGDALSGDDGVSGDGALTAAFHARRYSLAANVGGRYRPSADYGTARVGSELTFAVGGYLYATESITGILELNGATGFRDSQAFKSEGTPMEALLGGRFATPLQLVLTAGVGVGLTQAVGVPDVRVLLGLGWPPPRPVLEPPDRDGDGILDPVDGCPDNAEDMDGFQDADGCPDPDNDGDGVRDGSDECPLDPEDLDGFEDRDGCPEPDNDQDGILDEPDACPNQAEDSDGFEDEDGCPDVDNDQDGMLDPKDSCPNEPEDLDGFEDKDGCPDPDNDGDGIPDTDDNCPRAPGPLETTGCPKAVRIERDRIVILQRIEFETNRAELRPSALPILSEVRQVLEVNPQIEKVRIEGHTDSRGSDARNLRLSERRAATVMRWLVEEGIAAERLASEGFGEQRPLVPNTNRENWQTNRRVEFHIVGGPTVPDGADSPQTGQDAVDPSEEL